MPSPFAVVRVLLVLTVVMFALTVISIVRAMADAPPKFSQYAVGEAYRGKVAVPTINGRRDPGLQRAWREAEKTRVNAAARYVLLKEFCGSACVLGHLLDARTGKIIRMPFTISGWREVEDNFESIVTQPDSRLIVFRGARDEEGINGAHYYTLEADGTFRHLVSVDTEGNFEKPLVVD
jgi:hypothetical protein